MQFSVMMKPSSNKLDNEWHVPVSPHIVAGGRLFTQVQISPGVHSERNKRDTVFIIVSTTIWAEAI